MSSNIPLNKHVYEAKKARDLLDEEFVEFSPTRRSIKEFFNIYNNKFYSILNNTHEYFINNSLNYIGTYTHPKEITIQNLQTELSNIQFEIDNTERFHPIFPNNIVIAPTFLPDIPINDRLLYYIQSGKKRKISSRDENKEELYYIIKAKNRSQNKSDREFLIEMPMSAILNIEETKPIETIEDLNDSFFTLNTYNGPTGDLSL